jgi:hypothetical protein
MSMMHGKAIEKDNHSQRCLPKEYASRRLISRDLENYRSDRSITLSEVGKIRVRFFSGLYLIFPWPVC